MILYLPKQYTDMRKIKGSMHIMFTYVKQCICKGSEQNKVYDHDTSGP